MRLPGIESAVIPRLKVVDYLLCLTHPDGGPKARFFLALGFSPGAWEVFAHALRQHAREHDVTTTSPRDGTHPVTGELIHFGISYTIEGTLHTPSGRTAIIRVVWFIDAGEIVPRLVTAYPLPRRTEHDTIEVTTRETIDDYSGT